MDELIDLFNHTSVQWKPTLNFVKDIDFIISELSECISYQNIDIYEILVSCGHNLTWNQEYYISLNDLNWLKNDGKTYFFTKLNQLKQINNIDEYNSIFGIHTTLCELFELQVQ